MFGKGKFELLALTEEILWCGANVICAGVQENKMWYSAVV